jgi:hypothetical protein
VQPTNNPNASGSQNPGYDSSAQEQASQSLPIRQRRVWQAQRGREEQQQEEEQQWEEEFQKLKAEVRAELKEEKEEEEDKGWEAARQRRRDAITQQLKMQKAESLRQDGSQSHGL